MEIKTSDSNLEALAMGPLKIKITMKSSKMPMREKIRQHKLNRKSEDYFDVSAILNHKVVNDKIYYKLSWTGYPSTDDSWEVEDHLDGAEYLVREYHLAKGLDPPNIDFLVGSSKADAVNSSKANEKAWVRLTTIIESIKKLLNSLKYSSDLQVELFNRINTRDTLYLFGFRSHAYVGLYLNSQSKLYLADAGNDYMNNDETKEYFGVLVGESITIEPIAYHYSTRNDYCGSAAVLIAVEFGRLYKRGTLVFENHELVISTKSKKRIEARLHNGVQGSSILEHNAFHKFKTQIRCVCGWSKLTSKRLALVMHQKKCSIYGSQDKNEGERSNEIEKNSSLTTTDKR